MFQIIKVVCAAVLAVHLTSAVSALDPRNEGANFEYTLYPPDGFSVKK